MRKLVGFTLLVGVIGLFIPTSTHAADKSEVRVINTAAEATLIINGSITGYLSDVP